MENERPLYINDPKINALTAPELKLYRPKINYFKAVLFVAIHIVGAVLVTYLGWIINNKYDLFKFNSPVHMFFVALLILFVLTLRFSLIWFVRVYQKYAKSETRLRCCMTPSCSEYSILALKKYGAFIGSIKTLKRLLRCHPPGEVDYP